MKLLLIVMFFVCFGCGKDGENSSDKKYKAWKITEKDNLSLAEQSVLDMMGCKRQIEELGTFTSVGACQKFLDESEKSENSEYQCLPTDHGITCK